MSKEKLFKDLITAMVSDGGVSQAGYQILLEKGKELGLNKETVDILIKLESAQASGEASIVFESSSDEAIQEDNNFLNSDCKYSHSERRQQYIDDRVYEFKSSITRFGPILTPHIIKVYPDKIEHRKRNKHLINVDSVVIAIKNIASVRVDTKIWGADIYIKSYGAGLIEGKNFTINDARKIQNLIKERQ